MRLLMITRKVDRDDGLAGFTFDWVKKIGEKIDKLYVICLEKGNTDGLPENIKVMSVRSGVPAKNIFLRKISDFLSFQKLAWQNVNRADGIFCHMNPEYTIAVWPAAKFFNKKIISWYAHRAVTFRLRILEKMAYKILTPSPESFRLKSKKVIITGHGIDTEKFKPGIKSSADKFIIITVGRISPTKDLETLIKATRILINDFNEKNILVEIVGAPGLKNHESYYNSLIEMVKKMRLENYINFRGNIPNKDIPKKLNNADLFVNLSNTGSVDKAVLEAMSAGIIPLSGNEAFLNILPEELMVKQNDFKLLAEKILALKKKSGDEKESIRKKMGQIVKENHNLEKLTAKIINSFKNL